MLTYLKGMSQQIHNPSSIRPKVVKLISRLLAPWVEEGVVLNSEANCVAHNLTALAKSGQLAPAIQPKLLTAAEVSELLGISLSAFKHAEASGEIVLPRKTVGKGAVRYLNQHVFAYMAASDGQDETS